jgi:uncharacterized membrane protein YgcG
MVDFGVPEMADAQAHDLVNRNAADGTSLGVVAYVYAAQGEYGAAVQQLRIALTQSPDEPFVLRTAGQLVAWWDSNPDRTKLTPTDVSALEWIRTSAASKPAYTDAYKSWNQPQGGNAIGQGNPQTQPIAPTGDAQIVYPPSADYSSVAQPAYVSNYYYGGAYWGYPYYPYYTNPFFCDVGRPWHHHHFDTFHPNGFHSGFVVGAQTFIGSGHDHGFASHDHDGRGMTTFTPNSFDPGRNGHDIRPSPTFRGGTPTATPTPSTPSVQRMIPASPAPRDPGRSANTSSNSGSSGGSSGGGSGHSSGNSNSNNGGGRYSR